MKPVIFLRIAAVLTLTHAVLHTIGGVFGSTPPGPATVAVEAMKTNLFLFLGQVRSFWQFYRGFGLAISLSLTVESVVFWLLSNLAKTDARRLKPILIAYSAAYVVMAMNSYKYFFFAPVVVEIIIAGCLALAIATAGSQAEPQVQA